ncbi:Mitochondrial import inner membrane translocase subunit TIM50 [Heracleum sosnowskyi]|uniref:Mitochondrial import inner membrane translocase subunit TIM50 n=1 Tax=Heracleum sosnowskyi TaxID=360622 RepID=A0AAD8ISD9_9APIA|nr:Mitochondrial import inner membrane translocase subunit TIM50 [Heracleum sosnowskyi]
MSTAVRARLSTTILNRGNTRCFSVYSESTGEAIGVSSSTSNNRAPPPPNVPSQPSGKAGGERNSWNFLKYGLITALTGGVGAVGYATYAYSLDEIDEKTKAFRASANHVIQETGSTSDMFKPLIHSATVSAPAKLLELYIDLRRSTEEHVRGFTEPSSDKLLPDLPPDLDVFTLVLDLSETLIYSDWKRERGWRTFKRPGVDAFLEHLSQFYEIVLYTDQLPVYVESVVERLDPKHSITCRLSRAATKYKDQKHYRDLSMLNRDPSRILYLSGNALETSLQPENCVPVKPWKGEIEDTALLDYIPFLEFVATRKPADIREVLASFQDRDIPKEFIERSKEYQKKMQEQKQKQQGRLWRR